MVKTFSFYNILKQHKYLFLKLIIKYYGNTNTVNKISFDFDTDEITFYLQDNISKQEFEFTIDFENLLSEQFEAYKYL